MLAVVAEDEVSHWLIGSVNLNLNKACLVTLTALALEQALEFLALGFDLFSVPVCPLVTHIFSSGSLSLLEHLIARKEANVHL